MALLMLERRSVDKASAPPAWCEEHRARLRVIRVEPAVVEYQCPAGAERYVDRIEQVHVIEERWMREEDTMQDRPETKPETATPSPSTTPDAGGSQSGTSDGKPLTGNEPKSAGKPETK